MPCEALGGVITPFWLTEINRFEIISVVFVLPKGDSVPWRV
jgi:hypothetical protein